MISAPTFLRRILAGLMLAAAALAFTACGSNDQSAYSTGTNYGGFADSAQYAEAAPGQPQVASSQVPGLGTQAGEIKKSKVQVRPFVREREKDPLEVMALYYNSREGVSAMLRQPKLPKGEAKFRSPNGYLEYGLVTPRGKFLPGFEAGGRNFVVGEEGERYALHIRNLTTSRIEVVMSVDGLDVIQRTAGSFEKRGYILDAGESLRIQGFRYSTEAIQAFEFGTVSSSLANLQYGASGAANAGVVGFAIFPEATQAQGGWSTSQVQQRRLANPFPSEF